MKPRSGSSAAGALWPAAVNDSPSRGSRHFTASTSARWRARSHRNWKRGFWRLRATHRVTRDTGARARSPVIRISAHMMVTRVWRKHGLKAHRFERYMASNDLEQKAADILGLYLNPPAHVAVLCAEEKTHIQAIDLKDRSCRSPPAGRSGTALSTIVTAPCPSLPPSTPRPARPLSGTPRLSSSRFSPTS